MAGVVNNPLDIEVAWYEPKSSVSCIPVSIHDELFGEQSRLVRFKYKESGDDVEKTFNVKVVNHKICFFSENDDSLVSQGKFEVAAKEALQARYDTWFIKQPIKNQRDAYKKADNLLRSFCSLLPDKLDSLKERIDSGNCERNLSTATIARLQDLRSSIRELTEKSPSDDLDAQLATIREFTLVVSEYALLQSEIIGERAMSQHANSYGVKWCVNELGYIDLYTPSSVKENTKEFSEIVTRLENSLTTRG
ncbi:MAG: hypothetical protein ACPGUD_10155 [Parashewanella sp.]